MSLQLAILRKFLGREADPVRSRKPSRRDKLRARKRSPLAPERRKMRDAALPALLESAPPSPSQTDSAPSLLPQAGDGGLRPDPSAFASAVHAATAETAEGWAGNRRAFISKVWSVIQERHAAWALTEIEFKCMLTEAHRTGLVMLANADLKDKKTLKELQDSAVVYKNTVWHYVRAAD